MRDQIGLYPAGQRREEFQNVKIQRFAHEGPKTGMARLLLLKLRCDLCHM
jgi:hypothetical protein